MNASHRYPAFPTWLLAVLFFASAIHAADVPTSRNRPDGYSANLSYLAKDLYPYEIPTLQKNREEILNTDVEGGPALATLKASGQPVENWPAYAADLLKKSYEASDISLREKVRGLSGGEELLRLIDAGESIPAQYLNMPEIQALILIKWAYLSGMEATQQAFLFMSKPNYELGKAMGGSSGSDEGKSSPPPPSQSTVTQSPDEPAGDPPPAPGPKKTHGGTILFRSGGIQSTEWQLKKSNLKDDFRRDPRFNPKEEDYRGDFIIWDFKRLTDEDMERLRKAYPNAIITLDPDLEENVAPASPPPEQKKKSFEENGPLSARDLAGVDLVGSGPQYEPAPATPSKFSAKPATPVAKTGEYWFDPGVSDAKSDNPTIYVRINGNAEPMKLNDAIDRGLVPKGTAVGNMTRYRNTTDKFENDKNTSNRFQTKKKF